jgi:hypothetical protein
MVGFASRGSLLPLRLTQGLPVLALNIDQVDVDWLLPSFHSARNAARPAFFIRKKSTSTWSIFSASTEFTVTVEAGLRAASGETLAAGFSKKITTRDIEPMTDHRFDITGSDFFAEAGRQRLSAGRTQSRFYRNGVLTFNQPLDDKQDLTQKVRLTDDKLGQVDGGWELRPARRRHQAEAQRGRGESAVC